MSPPTDMLDEIPRTPVDVSALRTFKTEYEHGRVAFDLLREAAYWCVALGSVMSAEDRDWSLKEAIIGGHFVRLSKLLRAFLQQTKDSRAELAWVTSRLIVECVINVMYLIENPSDKVVRSYLLQSLHHDRELLDTIHRNIDARGGKRLPIEDRMLRSISRTFENVAIQPDELPRKRVQHWDGKTLRQKAEFLGMERIYQVSIGAASRNVHGSWYDLTQHHLTVVAPGRFRPRFDEVRVRPQLLYAMAVLTVTASLEYLAYFGKRETENLRQRLAELEERIRTADRIHEDYLTSRSQRAV